MRKFIYLPLLLAPFLIASCNNNDGAGTTTDTATAAAAQAAIAPLTQPACTTCDPTCYNEHLVYHSITGQTFSGTVYTNGQGVINAPKTVTLQCIKDAVDTIANCDNYQFVCYDSSGLYATQNGNIKIGIQQIEDKVVTEVQSVFPIQILKAIAELGEDTNPVKFYNCGKNGGVAHIVISFVDKTAVTHYLNLSSDVPPNSTFTEICQ